MDILGTEQEILSLFHNMCHVVIRAIAAVTDIDIFYSIQNIVPGNSRDVYKRQAYYRSIGSSLKQRLEEIYAQYGRCLLYTSFVSKALREWKNL